MLHSQISMPFTNKCLVCLEVLPLATVLTCSTLGKDKILEPHFVCHSCHGNTTLFHHFQKDFWILKLNNIN